MALFPESATGLPTRTQLRVAPQTSVGVPPIESAWRDARVLGAPFAIAQAEIKRSILSTGGAPHANLYGKRSVSDIALPLGDVDPANILLTRALANLFGYYAYTDNTTYQVWHFGLNQATTGPAALSFLVDNDVNPRTRFVDCVIGGVTIGAAPNGNFTAVFNTKAGRYDLFGAATQSTGTAADPWFLQDTYAYQQTAADATDKDLYIKRVSKSSTTWTLSAKVGAAASYSSTFTAVEGLDSAGNPIYTDIPDESGVLLRDWAETPRIHIPSGATATNLDVWKFPKRRARWSSSAETERPISSVETRFYMDDEEVRLEGGFQVNAQWSVFESRMPTSRRQGLVINRGGDLNVTITPTRLITDSRLQTAIHEGSTVKMVIDAKTSTNISGASRPYRCLIVLPAVKLFGPMHSTAAGGQNRDEAPVGQASIPASTYTYDSIGCASHFHVILENDTTTSDW